MSKLVARNKTQHCIDIVLIVKDEDLEKAKGKIAQRLNQWFLEVRDPPFPNGSLLYWRFGE